jgi:diadenosine tetraphosphate (Ap4A) HIT family hydrolase
MRMAAHYASAMTCVFCTDPAAAGEIVMEDARTLVLLHDDWAVRGHAMVVWKAHVENVADLDAEEYAHFAQIHHRAERALLAETRADRAVLLKLGIVTPHLHLHIYPVAAALDRYDVMEIIDARVRDTASPEERRMFADALRRRLA